MRGYRLSLFAMLTVAACGGNPFIDNPGSGDGGTSVPAVVKRNLVSATYVPGDDTITVKMTSQDSSALNASYDRDPSLDIDDYSAYTYQETTSNRKVVAFVKTSGSAKGLIAFEAGQFGSFHSGGDYVRADVFSVPVGGGIGERYTYSGTYVGLMNIGTPVPGPGGALDPQQSYRTSGRALITADFTEMRVSGGVDERQIIDTMVDSAGVPLDDPDPFLDPIFLYETNITNTGTFAGEVRIGTQRVGDYAGLFAGLQARDVATVMFFTPYGGGDITEQGMIVLTNCQDAGGPACP